MSRHSNHSLKIHSTTEVAAVNVGLVSQLGFQLNSEISAPETGDPYDIAQAIISQRPQIPYGTHSLKSLLDLVSLTGKCITGDETHPGVVMYAQKHDPCGTAGRASSNHLSVTFKHGHLTIGSMSASVGQDAMLNGVMHGKSVANVAPYAASFAATLPTGVVNNERYTLGKAVVLGTAVDRIISQQVDYNAAITLSNDADSIWPSIVDVEKVRTLVTLVTEDPEWLNATGRIDPLGEACAHANTKIHWLRRHLTAPVSGGGFYDFTGANHIMGTLAGYVHVSEPYAASGSGISQTTIQILGMEESGVAPIVWDTTSEYTTSF